MTSDARADDDDKLDEAIEESFPASDPPANTVETGIHLEADPPARSEITVRDNRDASRFEAIVDGHVAFLLYERRPNAFVFLHTEVPESLRGRGIANRLAEVGLRLARAEQAPMVVQCPFVRAYIQAHESGKPTHGS